jgi:outer membrane receptor protein involved in Fe transport
MILAVASAAAFASVSSVAVAQQGTAVEGRITGTDGRPLDNVVVRVEGAPRLAAMTDANGRYRLTGVPAGDAKLLVSRIGLFPAVKSVTIIDGRATTLDLVMELAATTVAPVTISATREARSRSEGSATIDVLDGAAVREARAAHPSQILKRIPGVYVSQLSGEGHSMAIRQPITTKPMYLYLEDGIPTRPTGFFNHNALYEVNIPQSGGIEVLKGPGTALYGSDAIGGVVNVLTRPAPVSPTLEANVEGGAYGYQRVLATGGFAKGKDALRVDVNATQMDGWRNNSPYERQSATVRWDRSLGLWSTRTVITGTRVDQNDVLALSQTQLDERDPINRSPLAYRRARAVRVSTAIEREEGATLWSFTPFARYNLMELLPSWQLTYDPQTWETRNTSIGLLAKYRRDLPQWNARVIAGADIDYSPGSFSAQQAVLQTSGTGVARIFESFTPGAMHYDYDVTYRQASPYVHAEWSPLTRLRFDVGARYDVVGYDYDTKLDPVATGAHRVPESTTRDYARVSPKLGVSFDVTPTVNTFASYRAGFRAPSQGQLFQQNNANNTVDLEPVKAGSYEVGVRGSVGQRAVYQLSLYDMTIQDDIITLLTSTGDRIATNAGETLHRGIEASIGAAITSRVRVDLAGAVSAQEYVRWVPQEARAATGGSAAVPEIRYDGKVIDGAPARLGNALVTWTPKLLRGGRLAAEWTHTGRYYMDPDNTREYGGYDLVHFHANAFITPTVELFARVMNAADRTYAELATFTAFQGAQLTPGTPRTVYAGLRFGWQGAGQ